jgi:hypothetical protein
MASMGGEIFGPLKCRECQGWKAGVCVCVGGGGHGDLPHRNRGRGRVRRFLEGKLGKQITFER